MKSSTTTRMAVIGLLGFTIFLVPINVYASFIVNDAALTPDMWMDDYLLHLTLSIPSGEGLFAIRINDRGAGDYEFSYSGIAEYYALYEVAWGAALTPTYAQNTPPLVANFPPGPYDSIINIPINNSVFLGYWDDRAEFEGIPGANDNYGWVQLRNTASGLSIMDGATAIGGGIYAGTYTQIPEPSTIALLCLGAGAVFLRHRRKYK